MRAGAAAILFQLNRTHDKPCVRCREKRMADTVVKLKDVWKIFGAQTDEAMQAIHTHKLSKADVLSKFNCVVGVQNASFEVGRGEIFVSWAYLALVNQHL